MNSIPHKHRIVKPALCDSRLYRNPIAPCEIPPRGLSSSLEINGVFYEVEILGYLPEVGEPVVDGFRLTKDDGTAHDICLVAGRMECTCGDWLRRRAALADPTVADCKHVLACKQLSTRQSINSPPACRCWPLRSTRRNRRPNAPLSSRCRNAARSRAAPAPP
jgi:hypothetical protein